MYYLKLFKNIIKINVGKTIQICVILLSLATVNFYPTKSPTTKFIISEVKDKENWVYVYKSDSYYSTITFKKKQIIKEDGNIEYDDYTFLFCLSVVLLSILSVSVLIASLLDDTNWEFQKCKAATCVDYVRLDTENTQNGEIYIYSFNNKLIMRSNYLVDSYEIREKLKRLIQNPNLFLDYSGTKKDIRNKKLNSLLV